MPAPQKLILEDDQKFALMKFRRNIQDIMQSHFNDHYLVRWLKARNWDTEAAEKMLRQSLMWREQWNVDNILSWEQPEPIKSYHPSGISGFDKEGCPVVVIPFGGLDTIGMLLSCSNDDCVTAVIQKLEYFLDAASKNGTQQLTVIFDMDNFNLKQYAWRPAVEMVVQLLQMYEANYPEILKICYIINAPRVFAFAYNVVKRFLHERTLKKIQIYKHDPKKWQKAILEVVDPDNLPMYYGGTLCDPDGNPKFLTKIKQGGKVPKSFYKKNTVGSEYNEGDKFLSTTIKKGDKLSIDLLAADEGSYLRWEFRTEGHDIRFGVSMIDEDGKTTPVVPCERVAAHQKSETGAIACQSPATYVVTFDNSYSIFKNKKLHYFVDIHVPLEDIDEGAEETNQKDISNTLAGSYSDEIITSTRL